MNTPVSEPRTASRRPAGLALPFDAVLLIAALGLCVCSLLTIGGATRTDIAGQPHFYVVRQGIYFGVGLGLAAVLSRLDYSRLRAAKWPLYAFIIGSIVAVSAVGSVARGSRRAIQFPFFSFQASELAKILLVAALAAFLTDRARGLGNRDTTARTLLLALIPAALVMLQPDLGSSLVFIAIVLTLLFVAGTPARHFAALAALGAVAVTLVLVVGPATGHELLHGYQKQRLTAFLNPTANLRGPGFQQNQSRIAIGSGEKTGRGDRATQTAYGFLPEHHTDFVFASAGERFGFAGCALVLSLYALLIWRGLRIMTVAKNLFGALIAGGVVAMVLFQVFVNVGMTVGIMPITGIPLPLMSYGGSSVITTFLAIGLLQSIYAQGRASSKGKGRVLGA